MGKLKPWRSIWWQPTATMRQLVHGGYEYWVMPLAALALVNYAAAFIKADLYQPMMMSPDWLMLLPRLAVGALLLTLICLTPCAHALRCYFQKEKPVSLVGIKAAIGWSSLPLVLWQLLWLSGMLLLGDPGPVWHRYINAAVPMQFVFLLLKAVLSLWSMFLFVKCMAVLCERSTLAVFLSLGRFIVTVFLLLFLPMAFYAQREGVAMNNFIYVVGMWGTDLHDAVFPALSLFYFKWDA